MAELTPSPELVREWQIKIEYCSKRADREATVAKIFQLGADTALDACCAYLTRCAAWEPEDAREMLNFIRSKPQSLKEQALQALDQADKGLSESEWQQRSDTIRRALESLPDDLN